MSGGMDSKRCEICLQVVDYFSGSLDHVYPGPHNHRVRYSAFEKYHGPVDMDDQQMVEYAIFYDAEYAKGRCAASGMTITACKRTICDCFDYEDTHGESQR
jgi:hypothetical protein